MEEGSENLEETERHVGVSLVACCLGCCWTERARNVVAVLRGGGAVGVRWGGKVGLDQSL